jgi:hypothetical protein
MQKKVLFKDIDINVLNLGNVLEEVRKKELTGYLRVVYWDSDEFLLFVNGHAKKAVTMGNQGRRILLSPENFRIKEKEGSATLVETTLDDLVAFQEYRHDPEKDGSLIFFPYGTVTQETVSLGFLDIQKEFALAERSHLDGYVTLYTDSGILGSVIFSGGKPVCVQAGNGSWGEGAVEYLNQNLNPSTTFMSMYAVEPEVLSFLYSLQPGRIKKSQQVFENYQIARQKVEESKLSAIILTESEGMYRYDLFFRGQPVERVLKEKGFIISDDEQKDRLSVKVENLPESRVHLYEVSLIEKPEQIPVSIAPSLPPEAEEEVPSDVVANAKSEFVRMVGPVGRLIWDKIIKDSAYKETSLTKAQFRDIIDKLTKEIPEEEGRKNFIEKIRSFSPDII